MKKIKRKVHVISIQEKYLKIIALQLLEVLGDQIELSAVTLQNLTMDLVSEHDIVILSKEVLKGITQPFIPSSCPIIIAKREVNIMNTKELLELPDRQQILIINDTIEHAKETAISLKSIFFKHDYIVHDLMSSIPSNVNVIVTPGEVERVPRRFMKVIDIGPRTLDFNTFLELSSFLGQENSQLLLMNRFMKSQVLLSKGMYGENNYYPDLMFDESALKASNVDDQSITAEEMSELVGKIEEHGFLEESLAILTIYSEGKKKRRSFGRIKVREFLLEKDVSLSEQQLRLRLEVMQHLELLKARQGRGGTNITEKGEMFLGMFT